MTFDDFKRKLAAIPNFPKKAVAIESCIQGTPLWDIWFPQFMAEGSDIHITIEPDGKTYTFYRLEDKEEAVKQ